MAVERLEDLRDPRLAEFADVRDPTRVRQHGLFVAESVFVVRTLLSASRFAVRSLLLTDAAVAELGDLLEHLPDDVSVFVAPRAAIKSLVGFPFHQGCLALGERPEPPTAATLLPSLERVRRLVVLENVTNPDNVGAVFRNALAFGVDAVLLDQRSVDPLYRKAVRSSMAATLRVPFAVDSDIGTALTVVADAGLQKVALTLSKGATDLPTWVRQAGGRPLALLLGNEGHGLSDAARQLADVEVRIPMAGNIDSLNVNAAAAIALYEVSRVSTAG